MRLTREQLCDPALQRRERSVLCQETRLADARFAPHKQHTLAAGARGCTHCVEHSHIMLSPDEDVIVSSPLTHVWQTFTDPSPSRPWCHAELRLRLAELLQIVVCVASGGNVRGAPSGRR